jgi:uncharacterized protein YbgA (DUF1722 family)/uncharacterized protein YbbK (DUF523 family)
MSGEAPPRIGISACLLGEAVRFDGGHKRDVFLTGTFSRFVEWVPVCPEVECGFGTPRPPMRLVRDGAALRLLTVTDGTDQTARLDRYARRRVTELAGEDLSGYVLKKDSPSCGLERVKVYGPGARAATRSGRGLFASRLLERFPFLPVEDEGRLSDPRLRDNFVERVFAYTRLRRLYRPRWTAGDVVAFHTAHKLTLMAHEPRAYQRLGQLVAGVKSASRAEFEQRYTGEFMGALSTMATPRRHVNVLQHMAGYLKTLLDSDSKTELLGTIDDYRQGLVPLVVPLTLLRHHVRRHGVRYLLGQTYLDPHPRELALRSRV